MREPNDAALKRGIVVLDARGIELAVKRIGLEILEANQGLADVAVVGIHRRGVPLGQRLIRYFREHERVEVPFGTVDITLYRDDAGLMLPQPQLNSTEIDFDVTGRKLVLVDDVLFTGRTVRAALDAIIDYGRPRRIQLAVLVDRGLRELPIRADFVGKAVDTTPDQTVQVHLLETDGEDRAVLLGKEA
jgi:pyrimidine operon attenuation protein/uracil phosphoribosyltransferase